MKTSRSPNTVAMVAYLTAQRSLPPHRHLKSPKKFTQHQLVACLVLKEFFTTDYRGIVQILTDSSDLRHILELTDLPHYTTLQKAALRLTKKNMLDKLLHEILTIALQTKIMKKKVFVKRKAKGQATYQQTTYARYPKVGIVCDCTTHLVLSGVPSRGPFPDVVHFEKAIIEAQKHVPIKVLTADADYDSEKAHRFAREERGIRTIIPARIGRPTAKLPVGKYRKLMATRFNKELYGQRWQSETVNSMLKRNLGSFLRARSYWGSNPTKFLINTRRVVWS